MNPYSTHAVHLHLQIGVLGQGVVPPPLSEHLHADHFEPPAVRKRAAVIAARHGALRVVVDELAQDAGGGLRGEQTEVDGALGVPLAGEDAAFAGAQRDHVARAGEVVRGGCRGGEGAGRGGAIECGYAGGCAWGKEGESGSTGRRDGGGLTVLVVDGDGVGGAMTLLVVGDHHGDVEMGEAVAGEGDADVATDFTCELG